MSYCIINKELDENNNNLPVEETDFGGHESTMLWFKEKHKKKY